MNIKKIVIIAAALILILVIAYGAWWVYDVQKILELPNENVKQEVVEIYDHKTTIDKYAYHTKKESNKVTITLYTKHSLVRTELIFHLQNDKVVSMDKNTYYRSKLDAISSYNSLSENEKKQVTRDENKILMKNVENKEIGMTSIELINFFDMAYKNIFTKI